MCPWVQHVDVERREECGQAGSKQLRLQRFIIKYELIKICTPLYTAPIHVYVTVLIQYNTFIQYNTLIEVIRVSKRHNIDLTHLGTADQRTTDESREI